MLTILDEKYLQKYNKLNPAQKKAVDTIEGPVMVIAGPGTGKTTILTLRIANILQKTDTPASGILAITFTEAGVRAIKTKLREIIGARADEVKVYTFHSFSASVIAEFTDHFTHLQGVSQMTDIDAESLLRTILQDNRFSILRPLGNSEFYIQPILGVIRDAKREALMPAELKIFAEREIERIQNDESMISTRGASKGELKAEAKKRIEKCEKTIVCADVYAEYENKKKEAKLMDFDDLIFELLVALKNDELLLRLLQEKYLYLLIDEHQDTNDAQNLIIKMLADFFESPNVFIVGDEKQAIYRFQGASVSNFLRFSNIWKDIVSIPLKSNYRSHQGILDASFKMIEHNYGDEEFKNLRVKLHAGNAKEKTPLDVVQAIDLETGEEYLVNKLKKISNEEPDATVALIVKTNREVERLIRLCENEEVSIYAERSIDIFAHPVGVLFFSLLEYLHNPTRVDALAKTVAGGLWDLEFEKSMEVLKLLRSGQTKGLDVLLPGIKAIQKQLLNDSPIEFIICVADESGLLTLITRDPAYVEVWRGVVGVALQLTKEGRVRDPQTLILKMLDYKTSASNRSVKVSVGVPDTKIMAMTAHGSKGLEFDYVFIPYATEESWHSRKRSAFFVLPIEAIAEDNHETHDARRLFYVAITRARKHVTFIHSLIDSDESPLSPSSFIAELDETLLSPISLSKSIRNEKITSHTKAHLSLGQSKILDYTKRMLLEKGLSVTALNHFMECPSKFIYKSILKVPEPPAPSAEKGNAMHKAFARIWAEQDKSVAYIQNIIETTVREHIEFSPLRSFEKEKVIKELLENAPDVAQGLAEHFALKGTIFPETWSERIFKGKEIEIKLHGKLDAIVDMGNEVLVFDYKTRGKMSVNAIKGETKDSDGNYFRQLVFYRLLLQEDPRFKGKNIIPSLVFVTPDEKGRCHIETLPITSEDIQKVENEIQSLIKCVWSGKIMEDWCADAKCENCGLKKMM